MKKKYVLLKDSPELKKGAILEEKCEDGDQDYSCRDKKYIIGWDKHSEEDRLYINHSRKVVEAQPEWFEEICHVEVSKKQVAKVEKFIKTLK